MDVLKYGCRDDWQGKKKKIEAERSSLERLQSCDPTAGTLLITQSCLPFLLQPIIFTPLIFSSFLSLLNFLIVWKLVFKRWKHFLLPILCPQLLNVGTFTKQHREGNAVPCNLSPILCSCSFLSVLKTFFFYAASAVFLKPGGRRGSGCCRIPFKAQFFKDAVQEPELCEGPKLMKDSENWAGDRAGGAGLAGRKVNISFSLSGLGKEGISFLCSRFWIKRGC